MRCIKLHVSFRKRSTEYRARLRKMTYADKTSYGTSPPCTSSLPEVIDSTSASERAVCNACDTQCAVHATYRALKSTLQATHCSTLQQTAAHCSTLQHIVHQAHDACHTTTRCNTLQYAATHCTALHHTAPHWFSVQERDACTAPTTCNTPIMTHDSSALRSASTCHNTCTCHCNKLQHIATCCNTLQHTARCDTLQHTARCNTLQHMV